MLTAIGCFRAEGMTSGIGVSSFRALIVEFRCKFHASQWPIAIYAGVVTRL